MWPWLKVIGLIVLLIAVSIAFGNFEAIAVGLLLGFFAKLENPRATRRMRVGLLLLCLGAFVMSSSVAAVALGPPTPARRKLVLRLYDLNCSAPFRTYRYPRSVVWLSDGYFYSGTWDVVLVCNLHSVTHSGGSKTSRHRCAATANTDRAWAK